MTGRAMGSGTTDGHPGELGALPTLVGNYPVVGSSAAEKRALARAQSYNYVTGGLCGLLLLALPHPDGWNEAALLPFGPLAILVGIGLYRFADRLPMWLLALAPCLATAMTSIVIVLTETAVSPFAILYLWVAFYVVYFLSRPAAIANLAFIVLSYAVVWATVGGPAPPMEHGAQGEIPFFVIAATSVIVAGILLGYMRHRLAVLVASLADVAQSDLLTGLPNARWFNTALETEISRAIPAARPISVLVGEVDRLRALTDTLGHDGIDELIVAISRTICDARRPEDTVGRVGTGTFAIVLPETDEHEALVAAEEVLTRIRRGFRAEERAPVTMSIGIATFPRDAADAASVTRAAENALDAAKALGHDRAVVASPELEGILNPRPRPSVDQTLAHLKTLLSLAEALDLRDANTASHAQRVGELSEQIARQLGLSEPRVMRIRLAGILHDIGKVAVPDEILYGEGPLDDEQWSRIRHHPEIGARILGSSELADIRSWVLACHERPDGAGYPRGLAGADIPLESRIIHAADAYETMTSDRAYRPARDDARARDELRGGIGAEFDADVVHALFAVLDRDVAVAESKQ